MSASVVPPPTAAPHGPTPVELETHRIHELTKARRNLEALAAAETLANQYPANRDVLYLLAMNLRYLNRTVDALSTLARLEQQQPRYSRLFQERGNCHVALRDAPQAITAFLQAVNINPALPASWSMLQSLYRMTGDEKNAATAAEHVAILQKLPPQILQATDLFADGELTPAESIVRSYLLRHGDHVEGMRLLARIGVERDVLDDAELLLESVLKLAPDYRAAREDYAGVLHKRQKHLQSREEYAKLLQLEPGNREYLKG